MCGIRTGGHTDHIGRPHATQQQTIGDFFAAEDPNTDSLCDELKRRSTTALASDRTKIARMLQILRKVPKAERQEFHALYHSLVHGTN